MDGTRDPHLHWAHPLSISVGCPTASCDGQVRLRSVGGHDAKAVGRCPVCGERAVLRDGVLQAGRDRTSGPRREADR